MARNSAGNYVYTTTTLSTTNTALTSPTTAGGLLGAAVAGTPSLSGTAGTANGAGGAYSATSILGFVLASNSSNGDIQKMQNAIQAALASVQTGAAQVGALQNQVTNQSTYNSNLAATLQSGASSLVDADMTEATTKLQALQTQQQLSIQALSITNQNSAMVLRLFGIA